MFAEWIKIERKPLTKARTDHWTLIYSNLWAPVLTTFADHSRSDAQPTLCSSNFLCSVTCPLLPQMPVPGWRGVGLQPRKLPMFTSLHPGPCPEVESETHQAPPWHTLCLLIVQWGSKHQKQRERTWGKNKCGRSQQRVSGGSLCQMRKLRLKKAEPHSSDSQSSGFSMIFHCLPDGVARRDSRVLCEKPLWEHLLVSGFIIYSTRAKTMFRL